jgi:hypothetical protein
MRPNSELKRYGPAGELLSEIPAKSKDFLWANLRLLTIIIMVNYIKDGLGVK